MVHLSVVSLSLVVRNYWPWCNPLLVQEMIAHVCNWPFFASAREETCMIRAVYMIVSLSPFLSTLPCCPLVSSVAARVSSSVTHCSGNLPLHICNLMQGCCSLREPLWRSWTRPTGVTVGPVTDSGRGRPRSSSLQNSDKWNVWGVCQWMIFAPTNFSFINVDGHLWIGTPEKSDCDQKYSDLSLVIGSPRSAL
jgi:hypothetical protein